MSEQQGSMARWLRSQMNPARALAQGLREAESARSTRRLVGGPGRSRATYRSVAL